MLFFQNATKIPYLAVKLNCVGDIPAATNLSVKEKHDKLDSASHPGSQRSWKKFQKQTFHVNLMPGYQMRRFSGSQG